jgi:hypothetical protein
MWKLHIPVKTFNHWNFHSSFSNLVECDRPNLTKLHAKHKCILHPVTNCIVMVDGATTYLSRSHAVSQTIAFRLVPTNLWQVSRFQSSRYPKLDLRLFKPVTALITTMPVKPTHTYHLTQTEYEHWDGPILGSMTFPDQAKTDDNRKCAGWREH